MTVSVSLVSGIRLVLGDLGAPAVAVGPRPAPDAAGLDVAEGVVVNHQVHVQRDVGVGDLEGGVQVSCCCCCCCYGGRRCPGY